MVSIAISVVSKSVSISVESISISLGLSSSSWLSISGPLTIVVSIVVGIWVSKVSMVGITKVMSISIMSISSGLSISGPLAIGSSWLSISGPLAIVVSIVVGIWVSMVCIAKMSISMVTIEIASISRCFSLASNGGEHAQGNNSNGFHHFDCLQARGFS